MKKNEEKKKREFSYRFCCLCGDLKALDHILEELFDYKTCIQLSPSAVYPREGL